MGGFDKTFTLDKDIFIKKIGRINESDFKKLEKDYSNLETFINIYK